MLVLAFSALAYCFSDRGCAWLLLSLGGLFSAPITLPGDESVQFNRDVRPILSDNCFECHGPDEVKRKADLRLDSGEFVADLLVPGEPASSELFLRVTHSDPEERMPPADSGRALTLKWLNLTGGSMLGSNPNHRGGSIFVTGTNF